MSGLKQSKDKETKNFSFNNSEEFFIQEFEDAIEELNILVKGESMGVPKVVYEEEKFYHSIPKERLERILRLTKTALKLIKGGSAQVKSLEDEQDEDFEVLGK